jgi:choice-of-anchor A domain-containing protein
VLVGAGDSLAVNGGFALTGNLGIGQGVAISRNGSGNAITGSAYLDSGYTVSGNSSISVSGGIYTASMNQAITDAASASTAAAGLTATAGLTYQGSSINVNGGSVVIKALSNLSENVLDISALSLTNGTITFDDNGYTGAKFIVNVTGGFNISSSGSGKSIIQGINGASAADVIFNIEGTGSTVSITGNTSNQIIGTILAPARNVTLGGGTLTGQLMAGVNNAGKSYTVQANSTGFNINSLPYTPRSTSKVPEPSSLALLGSGFAALALFARRRRIIRS